MLYSNGFEAFLFFMYKCLYEKDPTSRQMPPVLSKMDLLPGHKVWGWMTLLRFVWQTWSEWCGRQIAMVGMLSLPQIDTHVSATYRVPISYHNFIKQDRCTCFPLLDTACLAFSCNNHTSSCLHMHCGRSMQTSAWHKNREAFASLEVHHWVWSAL